MNFAAQLKQAQRQAGLTDQQTADALGVSLHAIRAWKYGKRKPPAEPILTQGQILDALRRAAA